MNLEDLKKIYQGKIDLKSFNVDQFLASLGEKKETVAQVIVVVVSVLTAVWLWGSARDREDQYRRDIDRLNIKAGVVQSYKDGLKKMQSFMETVPKGLDEEQFASHIADHAAQNSVPIMSFFPGRKKSDNFSDALSALVTVRAGSYRGFLQFVKDMEGSAHSLRIDSCSLSSQASGGRGEGMIEAQMEISSVSIRK
ncbi:MAG: hypothetical protein HY591_03335 [Candidatus Omnitrophica bacterium]|nr:hypothetical protein [Candidatus Omnitrophota bacterium]